jgi:hypothetical protein
MTMARRLGRYWKVGEWSVEQVLKVSVGSRNVVVFLVVGDILDKDICFFEIPMKIIEKGREGGT